MIIRKEVMIKGKNVYSLTLLKNNGLCSIVANTSKKKISRGAGLNIAAALSLFDKIITQKHYEHYTTEHVFHTKCPYSINDLEITPTTTLKERDYIHHELFKSIDIPIKAKRCVISFGVFNSNYIEVYDDNKILIQRFENTNHIDEFIVDAYLDEARFYIINLLCANSLDVKKLSNTDCIYWLKTLMHPYKSFNYILPVPASSHSHRIIHVANNGKINYEELCGHILFGMVDKITDTSVSLTAWNPTTSRNEHIDIFMLPSHLNGQISCYDIVSYFMPYNRSTDAYLIEKCIEKTSNDCVINYTSNSKSHTNKITLADQW